MNIVFISSDAQDADFFKHELEKSGPSVKIDLSPSVPDTLNRLNSKSYQFAVLDTCISSDDAFALLAFIRKEKKSLSVLALKSNEDQAFSAELREAGISQVMTKQQGYIASLAELLHNSEKREGENSHGRRRVLLLYAGKIEIAQRYLANVSQLKLLSAPVGPDGSWLETDAERAQSADALVLDLELTGTPALKAVKESVHHLPDLPILFLSLPGDHDTVLQAMRAGAADCIEKSGNYFHRLLLILQREIGRKEITRERANLKLREERLRHLVETLPAGVTVITSDGNVLAANKAALQILGATHPEQIIGRNMREFVPGAGEQKVFEYISSICRGATETIQAELNLPNGTSRILEFRAVPMRRDSNGSMAALTVLGPGQSQGKAENTASLEALVLAYSSKVSEYENLLAQRQTECEEALRNAESRREMAEAKIEQLRAEAEGSSLRYAALLDEQRTEREAWQNARKEFQEQCRRIEEVAQALRSAQSDMLDHHRIELEEWTRLQNELEEKNRAADRQIAQLTEQLQKERSEWDCAKRELEERNRSGDEGKKAIESALREVESNLANLLEQSRIEVAERDTLLAEFRQKYEAAEHNCLELKAALDSGQSALASKVMQLSGEIEIKETAFFESDYKFRELEKLHASREADRQQIEERHAAELAGLGQRCDAAENRNSALTSALGEAESKLAYLADKYHSELEAKDLNSRELQAKLQGSERENSALQIALQNAETKAAQLSEKHSAEISELVQLRIQLEQKLQNAEASLKHSETSLTQLAEKVGIENSRRETEFKKLENQCRHSAELYAAEQIARQESEKRTVLRIEEHKKEIALRDQDRNELQQKCTLLESALHDAESRIEREGKEIAQRDSAYMKLEQVCQDIHAQAAALQTALSGSQSALVRQEEEHSAEARKKDLALEELKAQAAELKTALSDSQRAVSKQAQEFSAQIVQLSSDKQDLQQKLSSLNEQVHLLQKDRAQAQMALDSQALTHEAELSLRDAARTGLEGMCQEIKAQAAALQTALIDSQTALAREAERYSDELSKLEAAQAELAANLENAESHVVALQNDLAQQAQAHTEDLCRRDSACQQLEEACKASEQTIRSLRESLEQAQGEFAAQSNRYLAECNNWHNKESEWERKNAAAEQQHATAIQEIARESETRIAQLVQENQALSMHAEEVRQDIAHLKAEFDLLQTSYLRISALSSTGILVTTQEGQVLRCNARGAELFGFSTPEEMIEESAADRSKIYPFEGAIIDQLRRDGKLVNFEWSALDRNGSLVHLKEHATLLDTASEKGPFVERILTDITEIQKLKEEIRRTRRVESTGDIATVTVQSLQDLYSSVAQTSERLKQESSDPDTVKKAAENIANDAYRGIRHAKQFLLLAKKQERSAAPLNLNEVLSENTLLIRNLIGEDIDFQMVLPNKPIYISTDRQEIVQLLSSVITSSREALPLGGGIAIEVSPLDRATGNSGDPDTMQPGIYVCLKISADGCAVQPERRMGSIRNILERMGGILASAHTPQSGNVHNIYLPRIESCAAMTEPFSQSAVR